MRDIIQKFAQLNNVLLENNGIVYDAVHIHPDYPPVIELSGAGRRRLLTRVKAIRILYRQLIVEDGQGTHVFNLIAKSAPPMFDVG